MEPFIILTAIIKGMAVSLGVGGSTFAILNFFIAIADGIIDERERNLLGLVYIVLRVAMVIILLTSAVLAIHGYMTDGAHYFTAYIDAQWTLLFVLYLNAILMTAKIMPSTLGPGIQASSWYTLGVLGTLAPLGLISFSYLQFLLCYLAAAIFAVSLVNGVMSYLRAQKKQTLL